MEEDLAKEHRSLKGSMRAIEFYANFTKTKEFERLRDKIISRLVRRQGLPRPTASAMAGELIKAQAMLRL